MKSHKRWGWFFILAGLWSMLGQAQPVGAGQSAGVNALILLDARTIAEMDRTIAWVESQGGQVPVSLSPNALFVRLPGEMTDASSAWVGQDGITHVLTGAVDPARLRLTADQSAGSAALAVAVWNHWLNTPASTPVPPGSDLIGDALLPPAGAGLPSAPLAPPGSYYTSDFLAGRVQVDVFLVESNGNIDPNTENWTVAQVNQVAAEVTAGVNWWAETATQGGRPSAQLSFNLTFYTPFNEPTIVATGYEPISRPQSNEGLWIGQVMTNLGYTDYYWSAVRRYNNDRRIVLGRDWAYSIFVANSLVDGDGQFSGGYFAYAYLYGPFSVMTYDNDGWGIDRMEMVTAHEMGHIFAALDEYASSSCTDTERSGYLNVANTNCENGDPPTEDSIMRSSGSQMVAYPNHLASTPVRGMLGWIDSDGDGLYDVLDTTVQLVASRSSGGSAGQPLVYSGTATDIPFPSTTRPLASIQIISLVEYRVDGGLWQSAVPGDGAFDEYQESFTITTAALYGGLHIIEVRATNTAGNTAAWSDSISILLPPQNLTATRTAADRIQLLWQDPNASESGSYIERSFNGIDGWTQIATVGADVTTYNHVGLTCGTSYFYRLRAYNAQGLSEYSNLATAATPICPPAAPIGLTAWAWQPGQILLTWSDRSDNEVGFKVERSLSGTGEWALIGTVGSNVAAFTDTNLPCEAVYFYRVRAWNDGGESAYSNIDQATTLICPPSPPDGLTALSWQSSQVNLAWNDRSDNEDGFVVERSLNGVDGWQEIALLGSDTVAFTNGGLSCGETYFYRVYAHNQGGRSAYSNIINATTKEWLFLPWVARSSQP